MIKKVSVLNIVDHYSKALYEFCIKNYCFHIITNDFQKLEIYFTKYSTILNFFKNPILDKEFKKQLLKVYLESFLNKKTFNFINFLIDHNQIDLIENIIIEYLKLVYKLLRFKIIEVYTSFDFTYKQKKKLINFLKKFTKSNEIVLLIIIDPNLIGGFLIKIDSIIYDYTVQKQLNLLINYLNPSNI